MESMSEHERAVLIIKDYAFDFNEPQLGMLKNQFERSSYTLWAVNELITRVESNPTVHPLITIEKFAVQTRRFSHMNRDSDVAFSIAYTIASDIVEIFRAME